MILQDSGGVVEFSFSGILGRPLLIGEPGARRAGAGWREGGGGKEEEGRREARWEREIIVTSQGVGGKKTPTRACEVGGCGRV